MSSSHYKWLEETLGARQTGLGQRPATAGRRRLPVQGLTIGEAATIIQARVRLLRAQYKSVSVAGIGAAELRLRPSSAMATQLRGAQPPPPPPQGGTYVVVMQGVQRVQLDDELSQRLPFPRAAEDRKDVKTLIVEMTKAAMGDPKVQEWAEAKEKEAEAQAA